MTTKFILGTLWTGEHSVRWCSLSSLPRLLLEFVSVSVQWEAVEDLNGPFRYLLAEPSLAYPPVVGGSGSARIAEPREEDIVVEDGGTHPEETVCAVLVQDHDGVTGLKHLTPRKRVFHSGKTATCFHTYRLQPRSPKR